MKCSIATEGTTLSKISESIGEGNQNFFLLCYERKYETKGKNIHTKINQFENLQLCLPVQGERLALYSII